MFCDLQHRGFHGFENLQVARAAAEISGKRFANLIAVGMWIRIQQSFCCHQDSRSAVAALRGPEVRERILQGMKPSILAKSFDRQHLTGSTFQGQDQAREHRLPIQQNRASSALAKFATMFCASVAEVFAQDFQQRLVRCKRNVRLLPIQSETDLR